MSYCKSALSKLSKISFLTKTVIIGIVFFFYKGAGSAFSKGEGLVLGLLYNLCQNLVLVWIKWLPLPDEQLQEKTEIFKRTIRFLCLKCKTHLQQNTPFLIKCWYCQRNSNFFGCWVNEKIDWNEKIWSGKILPRWQDNVFFLLSVREMIFFWWTLEVIPYQIYLYKQ